MQRQLKRETPCSILDEIPLQSVRGANAKAVAIWIQAHEVNTAKIHFRRRHYDLDPLLNPLLVQFLKSGTVGNNKAQLCRRTHGTGLRVQFFPIIDGDFESVFELEHDIERGCHRGFQVEEVGIEPRTSGNIHDVE